MKEDDGIYRNYEAVCGGCKFMVQSLGETKAEAVRILSRELGWKFDREGWIRCPSCFDALQRADTAKAQEAHDASTGEEEA